MKQLVDLFIIGIIFGVLIVWMDESGHKFDPNNIPEEKILPQSDISYCVIDSCEYITWGHKMAHKGNCRFCAQRRMKEIIDIAKQFNK